MTRTRVALGLVVLYLIWGSTYLAIRIGLRDIPPMAMGAVTFLVAGALLYGWALQHGDGVPSGPELHRALVAGCLLIGGGMGGILWAEQALPSGVTALLIASITFWMVLLDAVLPHARHQPGPTHWTSLLGLAIGAAGLIWLLRLSARAHGGSPEYIDAPSSMVLLAGCLAWALGSLYLSRSPRPRSGALSTALQMLAGGVLLLAASLGRGELSHPVHLSRAAGAALLYLTLLDSLLGFSVYNWLLRHTSAARVSTYALVNPVVAIGLGWAVGGEHFTVRMLTAAAVVLAGVALILSTQPSPDLMSMPCPASSDQSGLE